MIEILKGDTASILAWIFTAIGGFAAIWFFGEKIPAAIKWFMNQLKNWFAQFRKMSPNPFYEQGRITKSSNFFEQKALLHTIFDELGKGTNLSLVGKEKSGKSSLLYYVCHTGAKKLPHDGFIYLDMQIVHDEGDFFEALCDEIGIPNGRGSKFYKALRGKKYVLCLDNIERMTNKLFSGNERSELRGFAEGLDAPLTLLIASRFPLNELFPDSSSRDSPSPLYGICLSKEMPPFSEAEVRTFIETRLRPTGLQFTEAEFEKVWQDSLGHPATVQRVARALFEKTV
jgi:hypothetical protein